MGSQLGGDCGGDCIIKIVVVVVGNYFPFMERGWVEFVEELEGAIYEGLEG